MWRREEEVAAGDAAHAETHQARADWRAGGVLVLGRGADDDRRAAVDRWRLGGAVRRGQRSVKPGGGCWCWQLIMVMDQLKRSALCPHDAAAHPADRMRRNSRGSWRRRDRRWAWVRDVVLRVQRQADVRRHGGLGGGQPSTRDADAQPPARPLAAVVAAGGADHGLVDATAAVMIMASNVSKVAVARAGAALATCRCPGTTNVGSLLGSRVRDRRWRGRRTAHRWARWVAWGNR